jgi:hypothetical protein
LGFKLLSERYGISICLYCIKPINYLVNSLQCFEIQLLSVNDMFGSLPKVAYHMFENVRVALSKSPFTYPQIFLVYHFINQIETWLNLFLIKPKLGAIASLFRPTSRSDGNLGRVLRFGRKWVDRKET